jgi:hypothetical protein
MASAVVLIQPSVRGWGGGILLSWDATSNIRLGMRYEPWGEMARVYGYGSGHFGRNTSPYRRARLQLEPDLAEMRHREPATSNRGQAGSDSRQPRYIPETIVAAGTGTRYRDAHG